MFTPGDGIYFSLTFSQVYIPSNLIRYKFLFFPTTSATTPGRRERSEEARSMRGILTETLSPERKTQHFSFYCIGESSFGQF